MADQPVLSVVGIGFKTDTFRAKPYFTRDVQGQGSRQIPAFVILVGVLNDPVLRIGELDQ